MLGLLFGAALGVISMGRVTVVSPQLGANVHNYAWWIVVLSMLVPLYDYLTGVKTTVVGVVTRHPFRHWAGFFAGLSVGLGILLLLAARIPI